jgi:hypothetical protein
MTASTTAAPTERHPVDQVLPFPFRYLLYKDVNRHVDLTL